MKKTFPDHWSTRQVAFFAGLISANRGRGELVELVDECITANVDHVLLFQDLLDRLEPLISADRWDAIVEFCDRIVLRQQEVTHAK
jgi:hypothetical protein